MLHFLLNTYAWVGCIGWITKVCFCSWLFSIQDHRSVVSKDVLVRTCFSVCLRHCHLAFTHCYVLECLLRKSVFVYVPSCSCGMSLHNWLPASYPSHSIFSRSSKRDDTKERPFCFQWFPSKRPYVFAFLGSIYQTSADTVQHDAGRAVCGLVTRAHWNGGRTGGWVLKKTWPVHH